MAKGPSKRLALLEAYADLARRESFCIKEDNLEPLSRIQEKKSLILNGLADQARLPADPGEKGAIADLLAEVRDVEAASAELLKTRMGDNRAELRRLSQSSKSASSILKAYAAPETESGQSSSLEGRV